MSALRPRSAWITTTLATATAAGLLSIGPASALIGVPGADGQHSYAVKLSVGDGTNSRACTGTLVDGFWLLSAASCFASAPGTAVPAGRPALKSTATLSDGKVVEVAELVPRTDRDIVLARLTTPGTGIAAVKRASVSPAAGTELKAAGFGRTKTAWVPGKLHTGTFIVNSADATTLAVTGKGTDVICKGDTGGPMLNAAGELVAVSSRSWQGGCLGTVSTETRTGAISARVDDLGSWISQTTKAAASVAGGQQIATSAVGSTSHISLIGTHGALYNTAANYGAGQWTQRWTRGDGEGMTSLTSVTIKNVVRVFGIGAEGKVFGKDFDPTSGQWTGWSEIPGGAAGAKGVTATATGNTVRLNIIGTDGTLYNADANYDTGQRTLWTRLDGSGLTALTSATANNVVHIYAIGADGKVFNKDANYNTGNWSNWAEVPGGAAGAKSVTAAANGNTVHLNITGTDNLLYASYANYDAGQWGSWVHPGDNRKLASLSSTVISNVLHLYGSGTDGRAYNLDANFNTGQWGTNWVEIPGGLGS
ncbi:trypsin-like serine protease [Streptomyces sp. NPDC048255]|uniref:trypsin-like serine protease n=1 Tax=Streptomyces sp. NPDC048255 TaxID=3154713 RepID=UPI0033CED319